MWGSSAAALYGDVGGQAMTTPGEGIIKACRLQVGGKQHKTLGMWWGVPDPTDTHRDRRNR